MMTSPDEATSIGIWGTGSGAGPARTIPPRSGSNTLSWQLQCVWDAFRSGRFFQVTVQERCVQIPLYAM